jgi:hypothetical protein
MRFEALNLYGIYVAPIAAMLLAAMIITMALRWLASRHGLLAYVWHPSLVVTAVYVIVLSIIVLLCAG